VQLGPAVDLAASSAVYSGQSEQDAVHGSRTTRFGDEFGEAANVIEPARAFRCLHLADEYDLVMFIDADDIHFVGTAGGLVMKHGGADVGHVRKAEGPDGRVEGRRKRGQQRGARGHGRGDYLNLSTEEQVHDLPPMQRACPRCGAEYAHFRDERCEQVDWRVRLVRIVHIRRVYRRRCGCAVPAIVAPPVVAKPIRKGLFTAMFLARLLVGKYVLGQPLHRIGAALAHDGLAVAQGSLVGALGKVSALLAPLEAAIRARNAAPAHLHVDETRWSVFQAVAGKQGHRWWLWVFTAADTTVFRIERSRSLAVLAEHLGIDTDAASLPAGRVLLLSSDFYAVYQSVGTIDGVDNLWCWAHIRRHFVRAGQAYPQLRLWAKAWVSRIGELYAAHTAIAAAEPDSAEYAAATAQFTAALAAIDTQHKDQAARPGLHPAARKVLATLDREWAGLTRHQDHPELALDNNRAERALRTPVVGRKNFYGSWSTSAAELAARAWTITATAAQSGLNPLTYLADYLQACADNDAQPPQDEALQRFLPWAASPADLTRWRDTPDRPDP
jgi:transposase